MLRIGLLLVSVLTSFITDAQIIRWNLTNHTDSVLIISYYDSVFRKISDTIYSKSLKNESRLGISEETYVTISGKNFNHTLFLRPGSELLLSANASSAKVFLQTISFDGGDQQYNVAISMLEEQFPEPSRSNAAGYAQTLARWRDARHALRKKLAGPDAQFKIFLQLDSLRDVLRAAILNIRIDNSRSGVNAIRENKTTAAVPVDSLAFMIPEYYVLWQDILTQIWEKEKPMFRFRPGPADYLDYRLRKVDSLLPAWAAAKLRKYLLQEELPFHYENYQVSSFDKFDAVFRKYEVLLSDTVITNPLHSRIKAIKQVRLLLKGRLAPPATVFDEQERSLPLSGFGKRILYIDVWATWCLPCIAEFRFFERLQQRFTDNDSIAFIGVSVDGRKQDWLLRGLQRHRPPGRQFWAGSKGAKSSFVLGFGISGLPRYILLDEKGRVLNAHAPAPSSPQLLEEIRAALEAFGKP